MNFMKLVSLVLVLAISAHADEKFSYDGYRLVRLVPSNIPQTQLISGWEHENDFDVWNMVKGINHPVDVALSPIAFEKYRIEFSINSIQYTVVQENMQDFIDQQLKSMVRSETDKSIVGKFARYSEIISFIEELSAANSNLVSSYSTGQTKENRLLQVVKIKTATAKKAVWMDCGIHAREWISPATCVYIINQLVTDYKNGVQATVDLLNYYEFHILPMHNPDGYEYSHTNYRMWRKNRNKASSSSNCLGVDLNRNFGYKWLTGGSSTNPCSDTYAGPSANSELETQGVQAAINAKKGDWDAFFTVHTYGKWWFTLWGYTQANPPNYTDLKAKAKTGVDALVAVNNESGWTYGSSSQMLYIASGGSEDWAYGDAGIPYTYCLELRPGQRGTDSQFGFTLPEDRAPKAGAETYAGVLASLKSIKDTLAPKV